MTSTYNPDAVDPVAQKVMADRKKPLDLKPTTKGEPLVPRGQSLAEWRSRFE